MDKLSTLFLVLLAWLFSGTAYADDTPTETPTGTATFAAADGVLTVTASGDLTNYTTPSTAYFFTAAGAKAIKKGHIKDNPNWADGVNEGDLYDPDQLYVYYDASQNKNVVIENNATYFSTEPGSKYIESKEVTITFAEEIEAQLKANKCTTLKFALPKNGTPATLSKDQVQGIINSAKSAEYCFDFSNIQGLTEEDLSGLTYTGTTTPAWVVPDYSTNGTKISTEKKKSIAEAYQTATNKANNVYWFSPKMQNDMTEDNIANAKYNLNVLSNGNGNSAACGSKLPEADTKNVVVYLQGDDLHARAMNATVAISFDYPGISNLVLDNITLWGANMTAFESCRNAERVILQGEDVSKWTKEPTSQSSVKIVQSVCTPNGSNSTDTVCQIKVLEPGALNKLSQAHYIDQAITDAFSSDIYGEINTEDFTFLNGSNMKRLNLANATYTGPADDLLTFNNDDLFYLALPTKDASSKTDPDFYNKFNGLFVNCKNLKGLSYYDSVEAQLTATLRDLRDEKGEIRDITDANGKVIESGVAMGTLKTLTDMETKQTDGNKNIKAVRLAGRMCAQDLGSDIQYDTAGHLVYKITRTAEQGGDENLTDTLYRKELIPITSHTVGEDELTKKLTTKLDMTRLGALNYALSIETADLKNVSIDEKFQNDLCLGALGKTYGKLKTVTWPTDKSVQEIPTSCFTGNHKITEICIPENVKKIGGSAFLDVHNLIRVTTTGPSKYREGNVEQEVPEGTYDHGDSTATFSAKLQMIETGAFKLVENFKDVYCLGKDAAPQCQRWAFDTNLTFGNNGFTRTDDGLITRENFYKGGATDPTDPTKKAPKQWIAVLHFPSGCSSKQVKKYTDPTREYSVADGKGTTDGNGHLLMWPKHTEMLMSYAQGHTGYTWKAWNPKRKEEQGANFFELELSDPIYHDPLHPTQTMGNAEYANAIKEGKVSDGDYRFYVPSTTTEDYRGWHEFVLTGSSNYSDPDDPKWNFDKISDNGWWTICLPFDMTKAQMAQVFGTKNPDGTVKEYPVLCRLVSVTRDDTKQQITLNFGKDLVQYKDETNNESKEATDSASVVLHKGHPYMLKPNMPIDKNGKVTIPRDLPFKVLKFVPPTDGVDNIIAKDEAIINDVSPVVRAVDENNKPVDWYYRFIGTFTKWYVPENCYFFAWYGKESQPRWFYKNYIDRQKRFWNPNTCVIMVNNENHVPTFVGYGEGQEDETSHWDIFDKAYVSYFDWDGYTPKPAVNNAQSNKPTGNAKVAPSLYGFEGASGIVNQIKFNFKQADPSSAAPVYNLNGQMVSPDGDTSRLVKGIYIKNGRKFVVK